MKFIKSIIQFFMLLAVTATAYADKAKDDVKQIKCLAQNIYFESRGESMEGQFAVAAVTMNRVKSKKYPNSVCEVVWQRRQFSWTHDGKSDRPRDRKAWQQATTLADFIYKKYYLFQAISNDAWDITRGALHYYSSYISEPHWAGSMSVSAKIGRHIFLNNNNT